MKLINLTNHSLMSSQKEDAKNNKWEVVELPPHLKERWGNIPPELDKKGVEEFVNPFLEFVKKHTPAKVLLAGDFGATISVYRLLPEGSTAIQSTMNRLAKDVKNEDGTTTTTHVLSHVRFREL